MNTSPRQWNHPPSRAGRSPLSPARRVNLLLLDDDPSIHRFVQATLGDKQFRLVSVESVAAAIEHLETETPDLVLVDLKLRDEPGWNLLEVLRSDARYRRVPVVIITASDEQEDRQRSLTMGADQYLFKPVSPERLRKTIRQLLATRDELWEAISLGSEESRRLRELLYDPTAKVQTLASAVEGLRTRVESGRTISVFWIAIDPLFEVEGHLWNVLDDLRRKIVRGIEILVAPILGGDVTVSVTHPGANEFQCFTEYNESATLPSVQQVEKIVRAFVDDMREELGLKEEIAVFVSSATSSSESLYAPRLLYETVRAAKETAHRVETRYFRKLTRQIARAVGARAIRTVFQPIVDLETGGLFGFEALSRGPEGSDIERPALLFDLAREAELIWDLEILCIDNVLPVLPELSGRGKLFLNLESHFIQQLHSRGVSVLEPLLQSKGSVVIEVTERSAIRDFATFRATLRDLKAMGFSIAIDDCGSGYATLEAVAELQPDYLKVGHSLFHEIERDPVRLRLVELVAQISVAVGAKTIAEAIETDAQRQICVDLGIPLGQGYLYGHPLPWTDTRGFGMSESPRSGRQN